MYGKITALLAAAFVTAIPVQASDNDWHNLTPATDDTVIDANPLQGLIEWHGKAIVPVSRPASEHYFRLPWAVLEPQEGVYDFSTIEQQLTKLKPGERIAFGLMPLDTCCSRTGVDIPRDLIDRSSKGFWVKADPRSWQPIDRVFVPDWNDPVYIARWRALWAEIGKRYDGDPRIAWVDIRAYGNWGEGHMAGSSVYTWSQIPYGDPTVNLKGAEPGTLETRTALSMAIVDALPHTRLLAMTDDKPVLTHLLRLNTSIPIGMRRDSWGAKWFESGFIPDDLADAEKSLIRERWKTAPLIVESYGWKLVFEAGYDGITRQVEDYHIAAIGNNGFNVQAWTELNPDEQAALVRAAGRTGYHYVPVSIHYRKSDTSCPLQVEIAWRNDGVTPLYEPWTVQLRLDKAVYNATLPSLLPGDTAASQLCLPQSPSAASHLILQVIDQGGRTMQLPLKGGPGGLYDLGEITN